MSNPSATQQLEDIRVRRIQKLIAEGEAIAEMKAVLAAAGMTVTEDGILDLLGGGNIEQRYSR